MGIATKQKSSMTHDTRQSCLEIPRSGRHWFVCVGAAILLGSCLSPSTQAADEKAIAAVETYGLHRVARQSVLDNAGLREGAAAPDRTQRKAVIDRLQKIPGVRRAAIVVVVTPFPNPSGGTIGRPIVYIGIQESGRPDANFRTAPSGSVTLPPAIVTTYADSERAFLESIKHNDFSEDDSNGYALMGNEALRASQRKFVPLADQYYEQLVDVLQNSKDAEQRAIAATVIAYASNKKRIAKDLLIGTSDPNEGVRNDAVRALSVLLTYARAHRELGIEVSTDWCLDLLESLTWTDRNKAMAVLDAATGDRDAELLAKLRQRSLPSLIEMARWKSAGHAMMALLLVGRIAGLKDAEIWKAQDAADREKVIALVLRSQAAEQKTRSR